MNQLSINLRAAKDLPDFLTREEFAEFLSASIRTIDNLIRDGVLPYIKLPGGRLIRIPRDNAIECLMAYMTPGIV